MPPMGVPPLGMLLPWMAPRPPKFSQWQYPYPWQPGWPPETPPLTTTTTATQDGTKTTTTVPTATTKGGAMGASEVNQLLLQVLQLLTSTRSQSTSQGLEGAGLTVELEQVSNLIPGLEPDLSTLGSGALNLISAASQLLASPTMPWWAQLVALWDEARWRALESFERLGNDPWPFSRLFGGPFSRTIQNLNAANPLSPSALRDMPQYIGDTKFDINLDPFVAIGAGAPPSPRIGWPVI
eukprot:Protomagalhaensia_sp_Gyna_25__2981@NODE_2756_length_903_cov_26_137731_g2300_i0_p1_GENE_NODE_2756_length_903_cov_26_137731_g2300_i0NODE_2756_length_903_cov_26_137731_g2300_i0_p1_ORF_typecomplete_len275_score12_78_NODE_2756_length_903_cov_26_137731_g2300_i077793